MKRFHPIHLVGLCVTGASFALGWALNHPPSKQSPAPTYSNQATSEVASFDSLHLNSLSSDASSSASSAGADHNPALAGPLTDSKIEKLGALFRTSRDPAERHAAFLQLISGLTPENAEKIRSQVAYLNPNSREFQQFHFAWGKVAGAQAVMFGATTDAPDMAPALAGWASAESQVAIQWFQSLDLVNDPAFDPLLKDRKIPPGELKDYLVRGLMEGLAAADLSIAADFAYDLNTQNRDRAKIAMQHLTERVIKDFGLDIAIDWSQTLAEGRMQGAATERVASTIGKNDPAAALAWAESLGLENGGGPALSAAYAFRTNGRGGDPRATSVAVDNMPPSLTRDFAINGFTAALRWSDPEGAVIWAQEIQNPHIRDAAVVRAAETFFETNPAAANQWLNSASLPKTTVDSISAAVPFLQRSALLNELRKR
ncbi:MAG: hypothetical protein AAGD22_17830 [Verrucomicrobiota bacterium]